MRIVAVVLVNGALTYAAQGLWAQSSGFGICTPRNQRTGRETGCFIISEQEQGPLGDRPVFWHVTRFHSREGAKRVRGSRESVIDAFGSYWLMTIGDSAWRPAAGDQVAVIGPLPIDHDKRYWALYMEASMKPGDKTPVHRHPGPEAWYTLSGQTCLETPGGTQVGRPDGPPVIVSGGQPMELTATGTTVRQSIVLILHESGKLPTKMDSSWTPRHLCER